MSWIVCEKGLANASTRARWDVSLGAGDKEGAKGRRLKRSRTSSFWEQQAIRSSWYLIFLLVSHCLRLGVSWQNLCCYCCYLYDTEETWLVSRHFLHVNSELGILCVCVFEAQTITSQQLLLSDESAGLGNKGDVDSGNGYKEQDVILMWNIHWKTLRKGTTYLNICCPLKVT